MAMYTVKSGDTLYGIAQRLLGDGSQYPAILDLNPQITDPNLIRVGDILDLPDTAQTKAAENEDPSLVVPTTVPATTDNSKDQKLLIGAILVGAVAAGYWWWLGQKEGAPVGTPNPDEEVEEEFEEEDEE